MSMWRLKMGIGYFVLLVCSCSGTEDGQTKEPVVVEQKVPDAPGGDAGETTPKAAGSGDAGHAAKTLTPSQPENEKKPPVAVADDAGAMVVTTGALNVRKEGSSKGAVVRTLKKGEKVRPVNCAKGWCKLSDGEFVGQKFLAPTK